MAWNIRKITLTDIFEDVATLANAQEWQATNEKFIFCQDLLDLSLIDDGDRFTSRWVDRLEFKFEELLAQ